MGSRTSCSVIVFLADSHMKSAQPRSEHQWLSPASTSPHWTRQRAAGVGADDQVGSCPPAQLPACRSEPRVLWTRFVAYWQSQGLFRPLLFVRDLN